MCASVRTSLDVVPLEALLQWQLLLLATKELALAELQTVVEMGQPIHDGTFANSNPLQAVAKQPSPAVPYGVCFLKVFPTSSGKSDAKTQVNCNQQLKGQSSWHRFRRRRETNRTVTEISLH